MTPIPPSMGGARTNSETGLRLVAKTEAPKPEARRVSPLDKNAHIRRILGEHHEDLQQHDHVLGIHQGVLQSHAELHHRQAEAREGLKALLEIRGDTQTEPLRRGFVGRLRWLFTGR